MECSCKGELALAHKECATTKGSDSLQGLARCACSRHGQHACIFLLSGAASVSKSYIWAYASFQFAIVILFAHIFYAVLNVNAILSVLLSSFSGFGIAISTNSLLMEYLRWRASRDPQSLPQQSSGVQSHRHEQRRHQNRQIHQQPHHHRPQNSDHNNRAL